MATFTATGKVECLGIFNKINFPYFRPYRVFHRSLPSSMSDQTVLTPEVRVTARIDRVEHQVANEMSGTLSNLPSFPSPQTSRSPSQSETDDHVSEPLEDVSTDDDNHGIRILQRVEDGIHASRRKVHIKDVDGYAKGTYFYQRLAAKAGRICQQNRRYKWYHGLLYRWLVVPWRKLWSPRT